MSATRTDLARLKIEVERKERPEELKKLEAKIKKATAHIIPDENKIRGAAVKVRGVWRENPVKRVVR